MMDLTKLFEMQRKLDDHILEEHPELKGQNNLDWKILALQVELGECANEWRGFKKWSNNQEPRTSIQLFPNHDGTAPKWNTRNPLLEEYVDCMHFILSIGLEHGFDELVEVLAIEPIEMSNITQQFTMLMRTDWEIYEEGSGGYYHEGLELFISLGEMLGFTWEQVEQAYIQKNEVNHERQVNGY